MVGSAEKLPLLTLLHNVFAESLEEKGVFAPKGCANEGSQQLLGVGLIAGPLFGGLEIGLILGGGYQHQLADEVRMLGGKTLSNYPAEGYAQDGQLGYAEGCSDACEIIRHTFDGVGWLRGSLATAAIIHKQKAQRSCCEFVGENAEIAGAAGMAIDQRKPGAAFADAVVKNPCISAAVECHKAPTR